MADTIDAPLEEYSAILLEYLKSPGEGPLYQASLLGRSFRVTQSRGRPLESDLAELVTVTIHPSAVLRADDREEMYAGLVDDLRLVAEFASPR